MREAIQTLEIDVAAIHHVEGARFDRQQVEHVHIVHFPVGNVDKAGNVATQVEQRVQLDSSFLAAKLGPREQTQTQVDRCRVEGIDGLLEIDRQRLVDVQLLGAANQHLSKVGVDSPVVSAVGVGQRAPRNLAPKPGVIQFRPQGAQTSFDVPQAFAKRELRKSQAQKLIAERITR